MNLLSFPNFCLFRNNFKMLRGVTDVIVIKQKDGSFKGSPFFVHFSKKEARKQQELFVDIKINDIDMPNFNMKLDEYGDGHFERDNELLFPEEIKTQIETLKNEPIKISKNRSYIRRTIAGMSRKNTSKSLSNIVDVEQNLIENVQSENSNFTMKNQDSIENIEYLTKNRASLKNEELYKLEEVDLQPKVKTLTSDELKELNLKPGANEISYGINLESKRLVANIFLWNYDDKIVVCDVDGTVTKSDFRGQILQFIKMNWSHDNVAELFSCIEKNSYKVIYLSARSYIESNITRLLLGNIKQNGKLMPIGPVLLNPSGLIDSFQSELISKDSYVFKIDTLVNVKKLFDSFYSPFYAGFGNRLTDADAYRKVGISDSLIFITNQLGKINYDDKTGKQLSYKLLLLSLNEYFPIQNYYHEEEITYLSSLNFH